MILPWAILMVGAALIPVMDENHTDLWEWLGWLAIIWPIITLAFVIPAVFFGA